MRVDRVEVGRGEVGRGEVDGEEDSREGVSLRP